MGWWVWECSCFPLLTASAQDVGILLLPNPANHCLEVSVRHCFALPQHTNEQPRAGCSFAHGFIPLVPGQDRGMWSC